jgi:hypothetical protein
VVVPAAVTVVLRPLLLGGQQRGLPPAREVLERVDLRQDALDLGPPAAGSGPRTSVVKRSASADMRRQSATGA